MVKTKRYDMDKMIELFTILKELNEEGEEIPENYVFRVMHEFGSTWIVDIDKVNGYSEAAAKFDNPEEMDYDMYSKINSGLKVTPENVKKSIIRADKINSSEYALQPIKFMEITEIEKE